MVASWQSLLLMALVLAVFRTNCWTRGAQTQQFDYERPLLLLGREPAPELSNRLIKAARNGKLSIVRDLLDQGANIDAKEKLVDNRDDETALIAAVVNGHTAIVQLLLDRGANIEAKDVFGSTALIMAAKNGRSAIVQLLLDEGADIDAADNYNLTTLILATRHGDLATVQLLLDRGANMELKHHGMTALMKAAEYGETEIVQLLMDRGANVHATDNNGRTALQIATDSGHLATANILRDKELLPSNGVTLSGKTSDLQQLCYSSFILANALIVMMA